MLTATKGVQKPTPAQPLEKFTVIVPGDKIRPRGKEKFTEDQLIEALDKRYRNEPQVEAEVFDQALAMEKLQDAVEFLKNYLVKRDGHERDVILTQEELKTRAVNMNIIGILNGAINVLKKGSATQKSIEQALSIQAGLRRLKMYNVDKLARYLLQELKNQGFIFSKAIDIKNHRGQKVDADFLWTLRQEKVKDITDVFLVGLIHESNRQDFT